MTFMSPTLSMTVPMVRSAGRRSWLVASAVIERSLCWRPSRWGGLSQLKLLEASIYSKCFGPEISLADDAASQHHMGELADRPGHRQRILAAEDDVGARPLVQAVRTEPLAG